jgi:hypothetical protein
MVNSEELIGTTEHVTLYTRCRLNRCRYNRVRLYIIKVVIGPPYFGYLSAFDGFSYHVQLFNARLWIIYNCFTNSLKLTHPKSK